MKRVLSILLFVSIIFLPIKKSYAVSGEIIFRDAMYGGVIGFLGGAALYAIDQKSFGKKIGTGVLAGLILGTAFGVYEATNYLADNNDTMFSKIFRRFKVYFINGEDRETHLLTEVNFLAERF